MKEKIRIHVNKLFEDAPNTKRAYDLKEEIISNSNDKYEDLIKEGKTEEQAFEEIIAGIGDITELIDSLQMENPINRSQLETRRKKNALIVSISVGLYIISIISIAVLEELGMPDFVTMSSFFTFAGFATCMLIYHFMSQPKYIKQDETMVEEFKEWKAEKNKNNEIEKAVNSVVWLLIVSIYFIISFAFNAWPFSWVIFIIGAAVSNVIRLYFKLKE